MVTQNVLMGKTIGTLFLRVEAHAARYQQKQKYVCILSFNFFLFSNFNIHKHVHHMEMMSKDIIVY